MNKLFCAQNIDVDERLDSALARRFSEVSRAEWKRRIDAELVLVDGVSASKNLILKKGMVVTEILSDTPTAAAANPDVALNVIYEDASLIVVNKPAGIPTHPLDLTETNTALNGIIARSPRVSTAGTCAREGGLVHRLDNDTSGALVAAKNSEIFSLLKQAFTTHAAKKQYLAIVVGELRDSQKIEFAIAHHSKDDRKMVAVASPSKDARAKRFRGEPRAAESTVEPVSITAGHSLVRIHINQGQRHQIRVHMAAIGHPIVSDALYRDPVDLPKDASIIKRHALHAERISFTHPKTGQIITVSAPIPDDFIRAIAILKKSTT